MVGTGWAGEGRAPLQGVLKTSLSAQLQLLGKHPGLSTETLARMLPTCLAIVLHELEDLS